jgi:EAL domain-containing protein (putative c-di-GMP-specific phosphodiesterase class I)
MGRLPDLGRRIRQTVAADIARLATDALMFVNLHPRDLEDESLLDGDSPLVQHARRCVLELTGGPSLQNVSGVRSRVDRLRALGFRFAIDDLGAGRGSLAALAWLEPEIAKVDMSLVRGIDADPVRRDMFAALLQACLNLGIDVIAEGVETPGERDALAALGCERMQGYLFARPGPAMPQPTF